MRARFSFRVEVSQGQVRAIQDLWHRWLIGIPLLQVQLHLAASQLPSTFARSSFPGYCDGIWTHPCLLSGSHSRKSEGQSYSARDSKTSLLKLSSPQIIRRLSVLSPFWMLVRLIVHSICDVLCPVNSPAVFSL